MNAKPHVFYFAETAFYVLTSLADFDKQATGRKQLISIPEIAIKTDLKLKPNNPRRARNETRPNCLYESAAFMLSDVVLCVQTASLWKPSCFWWRSPALPVVARGPAFTENQDQVSFFAPPPLWRSPASLSWPEVSKQHHRLTAVPPHLNSSPVTVVSAVASEGSVFYMWNLYVALNGWMDLFEKPANLTAK